MIIMHEDEEIEIPEDIIKGFMREFRAHGEIERWRLIKLRDAMHNIFQEVAKSPEIFKDVVFYGEFIQAHAMRQAFKNCGIMEFDA
jgi:hypothetical protein